MDNKLCIKNDVPLAGSTRSIAITATSEKVLVEMITIDNGSVVAYDANVEDLTWEQVGDVEQLADIFDTEIVRVFKALVEMLGAIYGSKEVLT